MGLVPRPLIYATRSANVNQRVDWNQKFIPMPNNTDVLQGQGGVRPCFACGAVSAFERSLRRRLQF